MRRLVLVLGALLAIAVGLWLWRPWDGRTDAGSAGERAADANADATGVSAHLRGREDVPTSAGGGRDEATTAADAGEPKTTITGRILGLDGASVVGARALGLQAWSLLGDLAVGTETGADPETGRFSLAVEGGHGATVAATAPACGMVLSAPVLLAPGETRDVGTLEIAPEATIRVRVVDAEDEPVSGVEVTLESEADPVPEWWDAFLAANEGWRHAESDDAGVVRFHKVPPGLYRVLASYGASALYDEVREHVKAGTEDVVFVVPAVPEPETLRLHVRILGPDGEPVQQARVALRDQDTHAPAYRGDDGLWHAELEDACRPAFLFVWDARDAEGRPLGCLPALITDPVSKDEPLVIRLEAGGHPVAGRVLWDGPRESWRVMLHTRIRPDGSGTTEASAEGGRSPRITLEATTDEAGAFRFEGLPPGRAWVDVTGPGRMKDGSLEVTAPTLDAEVRMISTASLHVQVRAPAGRTFGSASLRVRRHEGRGLLLCYSAQGGGGSDPDVRVFEVPDLDPAGVFHVSAEATCSGGPTRETVLPAVTPCEEPYVLQLEDSLRVEGRVVRADGSPVFGAVVHYRYWPGGMYRPYLFVNGRWLSNAKTGVDGVFDLAGLDEGEVLLAVEAPGLTALHRPPRVRVGTRGHEIVVEPVRSISGRIVDPTGGAVDGLRVTAVPVEGWPRLWVPQRTAAGGFFVAERLGPGSHRIVVWNSDDATDTRFAVSSPVPAGARDVRVQLAMGTRLSGLVLDAGGAPVPGAMVRLQGACTNRSLTTGRDGRYAFTGVAPGGGYMLEVVPPLGDAIRRPHVATAEEPDAKLDITLPE